MKNNYAVLIQPGQSPEKISISFGVKGLLEAFRTVEEFNKSYTMGKKVDTSVMQLTEKANLLYAEDGKKQRCPFNRSIGSQSFYGTMLIINLDKYDELDEMTEIEAHHFCYVLDRTNVPVTML